LFAEFERNNLGGRAAICEPARKSDRDGTSAQYQCLFSVLANIHDFDKGQQYPGRPLNRVSKVYCILLADPPQSDVPTTK